MAGQGEAPHALLGCKASTLQKAYLRCVVVMEAHSPNHLQTWLGTLHINLSATSPQSPATTVIRTQPSGGEPWGEGPPKRIPSCRPWRSQPPAGNSFLCLYKASVAECHALFLPRKSELHNYRAHALHVLQMEHRHLAPLISRLQTSHTIRSLVSMEPSCWPFLCSKHYCEGLAKS